MAQIYHGDIIIEPFDERNLGTNSYDCRLGEWYFQGDSRVDVIHLDNPDEIFQYWGEPRQAKNNNISILPGSMILAHTYEVIGCKNGFVANMYSRSTVARAGLSVCRCAGVGDVGYISRWTMEITNHTRAIVHVPVGFCICQFTFEYVGRTLKDYKGEVHKGKYGMSLREWSPMDMLPKLGLREKRVG